MPQDAPAQTGRMEELRSRSADSDSPVPPIGVIVPTYNRVDILVRCLERLEEQTWNDFEVVLLDDGSSDDTPRVMEEYVRRTPLNLRYVRQNNTGPATARNHAISLLRAPICLMIGDDILASPDLVRLHLDLHRRRPEVSVVGLGLTRWSESGQVVTPFMRWMDSDGLQFSYGELLRGEKPSWKHFYTSNLSLKTVHLRNHPFSQKFSKALYEDIELGYRLASMNALEVVFLRDALAEHIHPTSVEKACLRMIGAGYTSYEFRKMWPQLGGRLTTRRWHHHLRLLVTNERWVLPRLRRLVSFVTGFWCPNPLLRKVLLLHHAVGASKAALDSGRA